MRILDRTSVKVDLRKLGLSDEVLKSIDTVLHKPNGIMLVTGPTGSGKTTTLYACLNDLNQPDVKIITTEDPVELQIDRLIQCQVREEIGLTFAACLRSILRQDPDIVMVGEIRDVETAQIAVEASLTGHFVLSTLHTNSAPETITRLLDMDIEPFLITASLEAVLAQRLVRTICKHCRYQYRPEARGMHRAGAAQRLCENPNLRLWKGEGLPRVRLQGLHGPKRPLRDARRGRAHLRPGARPRHGLRHPPLCPQAPGHAHPARRGHHQVHQGTYNHGGRSVCAHRQV
jgi:type II secretory ATPase GspE/PulE/Tfp pilus assembly ATPase PilB-like protein